MKDDINKNVLKFSLKTSEKSSKSVKKSVIKNFGGFNYIKSEEDLNGLPYVAENLLEYAKKCRYLVRVMRNVNFKTVLYDYDVPQSELFLFLSKFESGEFDGHIIEAKKYIPEDLA